MNVVMTENGKARGGLPAARRRAEVLRAEIARHNDAYYQLHAPPVSDAEYDAPVCALSHPGTSGSAPATACGPRGRRAATRAKLARARSVRSPRPRPPRGR